MTVIIHKYPYDQTRALVQMGAKTLDQRKSALMMHKLQTERED